MVRTLDDPELDAAERKALSDVREHGLHVIHVLAEGETPGWSYSVGLFHSFGHPEVVVFGLSREVSHALLNGIADDLRGEGTFEAGREYPGLLEGVRCAFRTISPVWYYPFLGWARWFHDGDDFPALQCIWPDRDQRFPWEPDFAAGWVWAQPLLYEHTPVEARASALLESMGMSPPSE